MNPLAPPVNIPDAEIPSPSSKNPLRWVARTLFALSLVFAIYAFAIIQHFDGILLVGLHTNMGQVPHDKTLTHRITLYNLTPKPVKAVIIPTCGCAVDSLTKMTVPSLSSKVIPIEYRIQGEKSGHKKRSLSFAYQIGQDWRYFTGEVSFDL